MCSVSCSCFSWMSFSCLFVVCSGFYPFADYGYCRYILLLCPSFHFLYGVFYEQEILDFNILHFVCFFLFQLMLSVLYLRNAFLGRPCSCWMGCCLIHESPNKADSIFEFKKKARKVFLTLDHGDKPLSYLLRAFMI